MPAILQPSSSSRFSRSSDWLSALPLNKVIRHIRSSRMTCLRFLLSVASLGMRIPFDRESKHLPLVDSQIFSPHRLGNVSQVLPYRLRVIQVTRLDDDHLVAIQFQQLPNQLVPLGRFRVTV